MAETTAATPTNLSEYQASIAVGAPADAVFALLADPELMPEWLDFVTAAETETLKDGRVRVFATAGGRLFEIITAFTADAATRHLTWRAEGAEHRQGTVDVRGDDESCTVEAYLTEEQVPEGHVREGGFFFGHFRTQHDPQPSSEGMLEHCLDALKHYAETGERKRGRVT